MHQIKEVVPDNLQYSDSPVWRQGYQAVSWGERPGIKTLELWPPTGSSPWQPLHTPSQQLDRYIRFRKHQKTNSTINQLIQPDAQRYVSGWTAGDKNTGSPATNLLLSYTANNRPSRQTDVSGRENTSIILLLIFNLGGGYLTQRYFEFLLALLWWDNRSFVKTLNKFKTSFSFDIN